MGGGSQWISAKQLGPVLKPYHIYWILHKLYTL